MPGELATMSPITRQKCASKYSTTVIHLCKGTVNPSLLTTRSQLSRTCHQAPPRWFDSPVFQVDGVTFVRHVTGHESWHLLVQQLAVVAAVDSAWSLVLEEVAAINASSIGCLVEHSSMSNT